MSRILFKWLQLKSDEGSTFAQMLGHSFFNSLGIAFSFTAINVLLIDRHGIEILPYIYLAGGVLVLLIGRLYSYLESRLPSVQLFSWVLVFCILWTLLTRGLADLSDSIILLGVLYCLYFAIYQLINLEFWGAAALIYDVRQSKRLFGLLSSGESVAKMGGYLLTPFIVGYFSLSDLLFFAAASFGISIFFLFHLSKSRNDELHVDHHHHHEHHESFFARIKKWLPGNSLTYLQLTSYFALFSALVYYLVHYSFLNRVESRFEDVEQLAFFFGLFFGLGKFINLFIKAFLFSRFFSTLKIGYLVLAFPFLIALVSLIGLAGQFFAEDSLLLFLVIFGLIMLLDEVLRSSVYMPSFFVLFQPLRKHERLEGHTFAKGYMEPIGMAIAGILMITLIAFNAFSLSTVIFILALSAVSWFVFGWATTTKYEEIVRHLLKNRLLSSNNLVLSFNESSLLKKLQELPDDPVSQLYRLKIAGAEIERTDRSKIIKNLFQSGDDLIIFELLGLVRELDHPEFLPEILRVITHDNSEISQKAAFVYCFFAQDEALNDLDKIIESSDYPRNEFLIAAVLKYSGIYGAIRYGHSISGLLTSTVVADRLSAARIIGLIARKDYYHPLLKLLQDEDKEVRKQAIISISKVKNPRLIGPVLQLFIQSDLSRFAAIALENLGSAVPGAVGGELKKSYPKRTKVRLIHLLGRFPSEDMLDILATYLNERDFELRSAAIDAAFQVTTAANKNFFKSKVSDLLRFEFYFFSLLTKLEAVPNDDVQRALKSELKSLKSRMLKLAGLIYTKSVIQKAIDNLRYNNNHIKGNVLEMLENELRLKHSKKLTKVIEFSQDELFPTDRKNQISLREFSDLCLKGEYIMVSEWTLGMLLRCCRDQGHLFNNEDLEALTCLNSDVVLQELNRKI